MGRHGHLLLVLTFLMLLMPASAEAAKPSGVADASPNVVFLGPTQTYTFSITNTGVKSIGSVLISRPSSAWTVTACPSAPVGWTAKRKHSTGCKYNSASGGLDNIAAGSATFGLDASSASATSDAAGVWKVKLDSDSKYDGGKDARSATADGPGALDARALVWEITDVVVGDTSPSIGSTCPALNRSADPSSTHVLSVCGLNHATTAVTPAGPGAALTGTFIGTSGTFASGAIGGASAAPVVLANYTGTIVTATAANGLSVTASITSGGASSLPTTIPGYTTLTDGIDPTEGTVADGTAADIDAQDHNVQMDANWSGFFDADSGIVSYEHNISSTSACDGEVLPTTDVGNVTSVVRPVTAGLQGGTTIFHCVRAVDAAGNRSALVPTDGVVINDPLHFNPTAIGRNASGSTPFTVSNAGDLACPYTLMRTGASQWTISSTAGTAGVGGSVTHNATYSRPLVYVGPYLASVSITSTVEACRQFPAALTLTGT